jgi:hypothetical protein
MPVAFNLQEGKFKIWKYQNNITHKVDNPNVQREDAVNWIEEPMVETCLTKGYVGRVNFGMNPRPVMIFYVN